MAGSSLFAKPTNHLEDKADDIEFNKILDSFDNGFYEEKEEKLLAIILGASGAGKSYTCGTLPGKTLFLNVSLESHGVTTARTCARKMKNNAKITGVSIDVENNADAAFNDLIDKLKFISQREDMGISTLVIDSLNMIETAIIRRSKRFFKECLSSKGEHNSFQETPVVSNMFFEIMSLLEKINRRGVHVLVTCGAEVTELNSDGSIASAKVDLPTYGVAQTVAKIFPTVLLVGRIGGKHFFQFKADIKRESKNTTINRILKTLNFAPRVQGLNVDELPEVASPDLSEVLEFIDSKRKEMKNYEAV